MCVWKTVVLNRTNTSCIWQEILEQFFICQFRGSERSKQDTVFSAVCNVCSEWVPMFGEEATRSFKDNFCCYFFYGIK